MSRKGAVHQYYVRSLDEHTSKSVSRSFPDADFITEVACAGGESFPMHMCSEEVVKFLRRSNKKSGGDYGFEVYVRRRQGDKVVHKQIEPEVRQKRALKRQVLSRLRRITAKS